MKQKKVLPAAVLIASLIAVLTLSCLLFASCGESDDKSTAEKHSITWELNGATVKVTGYETLPEEAEDGTAIEFTVTPPQNYTVASVTGAKESNGKYSVTLKKDIKITINTELAVSKVVVTTKPTRLTYIAGEELDRTGMVVTVTYADASVKTVTDYTVNPSVFSKDDESFTVTFKKVTSDPVKLDAKVAVKEYKMTSVTLEEISGVPYYVVNGVYEGYTVDEIKTLGFDFQTNGNYPNNNWEWFDQKSNMTWDVSDGSFKLSVDINWFKIGGLYMPHFGFEAMQSRPDLLDADSNGKTITVGGKTYTIAVDEDSWNLLSSVKVTAS